MVTHQNWLDRAKALRPQALSFIDGREVSALSGATFECISPRDRRVLGKVPAGDSHDIDAAVAAARRAYEAGHWRRLAPRERKRVMLKWADLIERDAEALALLETLDMGMPISLATDVAVPEAVDCIRYHAEALDKRYDEIAPTDPAVTGLIRRVPLGVVGAIVPWNFPLLMAVWKISPALAVGNSVVLKPAEQSPLTASRLAILAAEAGVPEGVLNIVHGSGPAAGAALAAHPDVDMIAFTGSTATGKLVMQAAGRSNMKRVTLECGGKSPHIIMPDAPDLERAAEAAATAIFANQGQVCCAGSRLLVHDDIHDAFVKRMIDHAKAWQPGDPLNPETQLGAIVDDVQEERVLAYIEAGLREGADLAYRGSDVRPLDGYYVPPVVFDRVSSTMTVAQEEIFGPVLSVIGFGSLEQAIRIANDTVYGLGAAIWTRDLKTTMRAVSELRAGNIWVNSYDAGDTTMPFGGFGQSGFGRDRSAHSLDKYTDLKAIWIEVA